MMWKKSIDNKKDFSQDNKIVVVPSLDNNSKFVFSFKNNCLEKSKKKLDRFVLDIKNQDQKGFKVFLFIDIMYNYFLKLKS